MCSLFACLFFIFGMYIIYKRIKNLKKLFKKILNLMFFMLVLYMMYTFTDLIFPQELYYSINLDKPFNFFKASSAYEVHDGASSTTIETLSTHLILRAESVGSAEPVNSTIENSAQNSVATLESSSTSAAPSENQPNQPERIFYATEEGVIYTDLNDNTAYNHPFISVTELLPNNLHEIFQNSITSEVNTNQGNFIPADFNTFGVTDSSLYTSTNSESTNIPESSQSTTTLLNTESTSTVSTQDEFNAILQNHLPGLDTQSISLNNISINGLDVTLHINND